MMRLYIDSQECPFEDDGRLGLGWSSAVLTDIDAARTGRSVTLCIPSTPQTDLLFGRAHDPHTAVSFNDTEHTARIECDGATVHEGTAVLTAAESDGNGGAVRYRVKVTGGAARWAKQASRTMFNALPMEFSMRLTPVQIEQSWQQADAAVRFLPVLRDTYEAT